MFDKLKDTMWDLKYGGIKYTVSEKVNDMKDHPVKTTAKLAVDVTARMIPCGTTVKKVAKFTAKTAVKTAINKIE